MPRTTTWLLVGTLLLTGSAPALAQSKSGHEGFWIGFGLGGGSTGGTNHQGGGGAYLRMGGTPVPQLLVGGEFIGWGRSQNGTTVTEDNAAADILFYPSLHNEFFLKVGLGFASDRAAVTSGNVTTTTTNNGFGTTFGAGYDIKLGRNIYLSPNFDTLVQVINSSTQTVYLLTIGLTWH